MIGGVLGSIFLSSLGEGGGLSTPFGEVVIKGLSPGKTYSIQELAGIPLIVTNRGKEKIKLKIVPLLPREEELKEGYMAFPDPGWIRLEREEFWLEPGEEVRTDVFISLPGGKKIEGKNFQVWLWSYTVGERVSYGLKSRLLLRISGKEEREEKPKNRGQKFFLGSFKSGRLYWLRKERDMFLSLENPLAEKVEVEIREKGKPKLLDFSERKFFLLPGEIKEVEVFLKIPSRFSPGEYIRKIEVKRGEEKEEHLIKFRVENE